MPRGILAHLSVENAVRMCVCVCVCVCAALESTNGLLKAHE